MYTVIGSDGQVYGPVDVDTIKKWIADGRVIAATNLVDAFAGRTLRASDVPELVGMFNTAPPLANQAPPRAIDVPGASVFSGPEGRAAIQVNNIIQGPSAMVGGTSSRTRVAYILLGFFLGALGIHNFYAGYTGRGAAQLLITLLTGWLILPILFVCLWVIIEIITVTTDADGRRLT